MPTPNKGEKEKDYISRCIPIVLEEGTAKDEEQAAAICFSMFEEHQKKEAMVESVKGAVDKGFKEGIKLIKGGPGSGSWNGPGDPRGDQSMKDQEDQISRERQQRRDERDFGGEKDKPKKDEKDVEKSKKEGVAKLEKMLGNGMVLDVDKHTVSSAGVHNITAYTYGTPVEMSIALKNSGFEKDKSSSMLGLGHYKLVNEKTKDTIEVKYVNRGSKFGMTRVDAKINDMSVYKPGKK